MAVSPESKPETSSTALLATVISSSVEGKLAVMELLVHGTSILKEISPAYSLEGLMLKLQYFSHLMQRADSVEKILMLGKTEGRRRGDDRG